MTKKALQAGKKYDIKFLDNCKIKYLRNKIFNNVYIESVFSINGAFLAKAIFEDGRQRVIPGSKYIEILASY